MRLDNAGLGQLIRYMTRMGGGGFESRLSVLYRLLVRAYVLLEIAAIYGTAISNPAVILPEAGDDKSHAWHL